MNKVTIKQKIILIIFGLFLGIVLLELGLRVAGLTYLSLQEYKNIISLRQKDSCRILCLGESTTFLGGKNSYPHQLEKILNQQDVGLKFNVINKGVPGIDSGYIASRLEGNLDKYSPDIVVTMMGVNDRWPKEDMPERDAVVIKLRLFFNSLRVCKVAKIIQQRIINKAREQNAAVVSNDPIQLSNVSVGQGFAFKKAAEIAEQNRATLEDFLEHYSTQQRYEQAEAMFDQAMKQQAKNVKTFKQLGGYYSTQQRYEQAEAMFKKAAEIAEQNRATLEEFLEHYSTQQRHEQAEAMFKKAAEIAEQNRATLEEFLEHYSTQQRYEQAEAMFDQAMKQQAQARKAKIGLRELYHTQQRYEQAEAMFKKALENISREPEKEEELGGEFSMQQREKYNPVTQHNYRKLKDLVIKRGIILICLQYPMCSVQPLKKVLGSDPGLLFVDNETIFKQTVQQEGYQEYFEDNFGGEFGHCTAKGNRLMAENVAKVILQEIGIVK
ncbi:tetratricopeptide repeat protein [Candidatus Omnitrophota bacterium]